MLHRFHLNPQLRFSLPVIIENVATVLIGLVFSSIIGGISASSLSAVGLITTVQLVLISLGQFLTTGAPVLVARLVGEGDQKETSRAVEQSILIAIVYGAAVMLLCELFSSPLMRLLLPSAEESVRQEGLLYFRVLVLSYPLLLLYNTLGSVLRGAGESISSMLGAIVMNLVQILAAFVLISGLKLDLIGAGLSYMICRLAGVALLFYFVLHSHRHFHVHFRSIFRPVRSIILRIVKLGAPVTFESLGVQICYLLTNSITMNLGTLEATSYQVMNTLTTFSLMPQTIFSVITITTIGQALGAGDREGARRSQRTLLRTGLCVSFSLGLLLALLGPVVVPLYTKDPYVQQRSIQLLWLMLLFCMPGITINVNDPVLKTGGDARFVMWYNIGFIWLMRVPMSLLFCYVFHMGAAGVVLANVINVIFRSFVCQIRVRRGKWLYLSI